MLGTEVRDTLERLCVPPESPEFFEELRGLMQAQDRSQARRWRRTGVALAAVAVAALAAAAVVAGTRGGGTTIDRTVSCRTQLTAGVRSFGIDALPIPQGFDYAVLGVTTGHTGQLLVVDTRFKGFQLDGSSCRPVKRQIPLIRAKLPSAGVYGAGVFSGFGARCLLPGRVLLRVRLHLDAAGKPQSALLALRLQTKNRPVAFVRWSPKRVAAYLSPLCEQQ